MARLRRAGLLASTALAAAMICAAGAAHAQQRRNPTSQQPQACRRSLGRDSQAQTRDPSVPSLFDPHFEQRDGRRAAIPQAGQLVATVSSGAGTTGFDATNSRARRKAKEEAQKRARDGGGEPPAGGAGRSRPHGGTGIPEEGERGGGAPARDQFGTGSARCDRRDRPASDPQARDRGRSVRAGRHLSGARFWRSPRSRSRPAITAIRASA